MKRASTPHPSTPALLLEAAAERFLAQGYAGVSLVDIARAVGAYPNQVTHHFGGKDGLYVHAACLLLLREARQMQAAVAEVMTVEAHVRGALSHLLGRGSSAVMRFAEALLIARSNEGLRCHMQQTLDQLREASAQNLLLNCQRHGWKAAIDAQAISRAFWAAVMGLALEQAAMGDAFDMDNAEAVALTLMQLRR